MLLSAMDFFVAVLPVPSNLIVSWNPLPFVPFRAWEWAIPRQMEFRERSTFFRGITKTVQSLFRGIFSERLLATLALIDTI